MFAPVQSGQYQPPTSTSSKDCVAAVAAMLVERATVGAIRPDHTDIRRASTAPSTRGLLATEAAAAVKKLYGLEFEVSLGLSRSTMRDTVAGGAGVGPSIDTGETRYTTRRTNYYVGGHRVYASKYQYHPAGDTCDCEKGIRTAHGEYLVEDPGTTSVGYLWWSADLLYRAAEERGGGAIDLLVAPDTEGVRWVAKLTSQIRTEPSYSTGHSVGRLVVGHVYQGGRTEKGGRWKRADGTYANGWIHIEYGGDWRWIKGRAARVA